MEKLDKIFSEYVRLRDADTNGYVRCYCCGYPVHWKLAHNGHFMNRRHLGTRFDERNCHGCCVPCNTYNNGNLEAYEAHLINDYGETIMPILEMLKHTITKLSEMEIRELEIFYKQKVRELKRKKSL